MTEQEARGYIQGKLNCMKKCGVFDRIDSVNKVLCDDCDYCYSQGNFGEQKEAFELAIKALEEIQQYRAIGTPEECRAAVEKQKEKKPFDVSETDENDNAYVECPVCHCRTDYAIHSITKGHCWKCGQLLDWSDE